MLRLVSNTQPSSLSLLISWSYRHVPQQLVQELNSPGVEM